MGEELAENVIIGEDEVDVKLPINVNVIASRRKLEQIDDALSSKNKPAPWRRALGIFVTFHFVTFAWIFSVERASLGFTEAEIAFLFPAPVTRRALVHFRLLSGQLRSLVGATIMMLISNRWSFLGGNALTHALGWWFVFSALNLHYSGANFTLTRLSDLGLGAVRRRILALLGVAGVIALTIWRLPAAARLPVANDTSALRPFTDWITARAGADSTCLHAAFSSRVSSAPMTTPSATSPAIA